jgi:glycosylphosphatidylinositol transamidase (GPIT) subunit GPI8
LALSSNCEWSYFISSSCHHFNFRHPACPRSFSKFHKRRCHCASPFMFICFIWSIPSLAVWLLRQHGLWK